MVSIILNGTSWRSRSSFKSGPSPPAGEVEGVGGGVMSQVGYGELVGGGLREKVAIIVAGRAGG